MSLLGKMWVFGVLGTYWFKYHSNEWEHPRGFKVFQTRKALMHDDPEYPHNTSQIKTKVSQYYDNNFSKSAV